VFAAKYQLKQVTVAILNCVSFHSLCCLMNKTRSTAVAERPRDASCHWIFC